jgi:hypothetical protein
LEEQQVMSLDNEPRVERVIIDEPTIVRREQVVVRERGSSAGWWVATIVAVIAVMGLIFIYASRPGEADLQAAQDAGRTQAVVDNATTQAQAAATSASIASANAADSMARSTQAAASSARAAADRTAQAADAAATNAADTVSEPTPPSNPQ